MKNILPILLLSVALLLTACSAGEAVPTLTQSQPIQTTAPIETSASAETTESVEVVVPAPTETVATTQTPPAASKQETVAAQDDKCNTCGGPIDAGTFNAAEFNVGTGMCGVCYLNSLPPQTCGRCGVVFAVDEIPTNGECPDCRYSQYRYTCSKCGQKVLFFDTQNLCTGCSVAAETP